LFVQIMGQPLLGMIQTINVDTPKNNGTNNN